MDEVDLTSIIRQVNKGGNQGSSARNEQTG
jgi:hypothetical protein